MKFDGSTGVKIVSALASVACFVLMCSFWKSLDHKYYRFCLSTIFTGFAVVCIALALAVVCGTEVDKSFNRIFAMYGVAAYLGTASSCFIHAYSEKMDDYCVAAGAVAALQAIFLTVDALFLLKDQPAEHIMSPVRQSSRVQPVEEESPQLSTDVQPPQQPTQQPKPVAKTNPS